MQEETLQAESVARQELKLSTCNCSISTVSSLEAMKPMERHIPEVSPSLWVAYALHASSTTGSFLQYAREPVPAFVSRSSFTGRCNPKATPSYAVIMLIISVSNIARLETTPGASWL